MSIRLKLYIAFFIMVVLTVIIGGEGIFAFSRTQGLVENTKRQVNYISDSLVPASNSLASLSTNTKAAGLRFYSYSFNNYPADFNMGNENLRIADQKIKEIEDILAATSGDRLLTARRDLPEIKKMIGDISLKTVDLNKTINSLDGYRAEVEIQVANMYKILDDLLEEATESIKSNILDESKNGAIAEISPLMGRRFDRVSFIDNLSDELNKGQTLYRTGQSYFGDKAAEYFAQSIDAMKKLAVTTTEYANDPARVGRRQETKDAFLSFAKEIDYYRTSVSNYAAAWRESDRLTGEISATSTALLTKSDELSTYNSTTVAEQTNAVADATQRIDTLVDGSATLSIVVLIIAIIVGVVFAVVITRGVTLPINRVIERLAKAEGEIGSASTQISTESGNLADGAAEQAASLEETSAALEEMASMTRQNADNAKQTNNMTRSTAKIVAEGSEAMQEMSVAMEEISDRSDKVSQIIKTISDIAFQTNLLALNAAVEAARAGEAGKGFAVVADEVRNLSQRSAQAARDTSSLIEGTVESVKNGNAIAHKLTGSFKGIEEGTNKMADLVEQITNATNEQAQGVDQVNTAVAQMDKVTQQNSAAAANTASASHDLEEQITDLRGDIGDLLTIVHGRNPRVDANDATGSQRKIEKKMHRMESRRYKHGSTRMLSGPGGNVKTMRPDEIIAFD